MTDYSKNPMPTYTLTVTMTVRAVTPAAAVEFMHNTLTRAATRGWSSPPFDVQSINAAPTRAAVPIVNADGYSLGWADRDQAGYTPTTYTYDTYEEAKAAAALWNERAGVSAREAAEIQLSTMR